MRQLANNVTGDSEQAGFVGPSGTSLRRKHLDGKTNYELIKELELMRQVVERKSESCGLHHPNHAIAS